MDWSPPERPRWVRRLNAHGSALGGADRLVSLDGDEMIETAVRSAGLRDFGDDAWREHYEILVAALRDESRLHLVGRMLARAEILRSLRNRLQLAQLWKRRPEILESPLDPPVFIVGSARSGTSILFELLACDAASRAPAMWEMFHPVESLEGERLRGVGDDVTQFWHDLQPEYETMHANSGDLPNECLFVTMNEFLSDHYSGSHAIPSYDAHVAGADHREAYRLHERVLKTLQQRRRGERWLLKAPSHLFQLAALFSVYPHARIVHTHRDPLKTIPSTVSLMATLKWMRCESPDVSAMPTLLSRGLAYGYRHEIDARASGELPDEQFVDVRYEDLIRDPIATIRSIYERLGWKLGDPVRKQMLDYLARKPKGARGAHRYSLEEMGLDPAAENERFRFYRERFGVEEEA